MGLHKSFVIILCFHFHSSLCFLIYPSQVFSGPRNTCFFLKSPVHTDVLECSNFPKKLSLVFPSQALGELNRNLLPHTSAGCSLCLIMFLSNACHFSGLVSSDFGETEMKACVNPSGSPQTSQSRLTPLFVTEVFFAPSRTGRVCDKSN